MQRLLRPRMPLPKPGFGAGVPCSDPTRECREKQKFLRVQLFDVAVSPLAPEYHTQLGYQRQLCELAEKAAKEPLERVGTRRPLRMPRSVLGGPHRGGAHQPAACLI